MKTQFYKILFFLLCVMLNVSCTKHNGDIGPLFGLWKVTAINVDDVTDEDYDGCMYFAFQSSVISMTIVNEETHESKITYASWKYEGEDLIIDFSDKNYGPFADATGMQRGQNRVEVVSLKGDDLTLSYLTAKGKKYVYYLKKWGY